MNGSTGNTSGDNEGKFRMKPGAVGDRLPAWVVEELIRRGYVIFSLVPDTNVVIQAEEPEDKTKVWYKADANGVPQGSAQVYNSLTGKWGPDNQGTVPYVAPLTRYGRMTANAGVSTVVISYESVKTNKVHITLTPTTVQPDGSFNDSVVAPQALGSGLYWVVTSFTDTSATIDFYAVPTGGFTFLWKVEAIPA